MVGVGETAERSTAGRSVGHAVEKLREVVVVISGVEDFGIRSVLLTQFHHAALGRLRFRYLAARDGDCAQALRAAGATVEVVGGEIALGHPGRLVLLPLLWLRRLPDLYRAWRGLRRGLRRAPGGIVYVHAYDSLTLSWLAARGLGRRLVCHLHNDPNLRRLLGLQRILVSLVVAALAARLVAISDFVAASLWGPARRKVCRIDNGVDLRSIMAVAQGVAKEPRRIVIVGRLVARKKQEVAIRAVKLLHQRGLACDLEIIGGRNPRDPAAGHERSLRDLSAALGLAEHVHFAGVLSPPYRRVAAAAACVSCATREPFGLVVIEAAACGTAVVAADAGGTAELVAHRKTGLLFRRDDPAALADALEELLGDPALGAELAAAARRQALERYDIGVHLRAMRRCLDLALAAP
jgi:glycosyltransferase involved in cell wall biosynthesis